MRSGCWQMAKSETRRQQQDVHVTFFSCNIVSCLPLWLDECNECSLFLFFKRHKKSNSGINKRGLIFSHWKKSGGRGHGEVSFLTVHGREESL